MKQFNVISPVYRNASINFDGFVVDFDIEGKGTLNIKENQTEALEKILEIHPNIYKGDILPEILKISEVKEEGTKATAQSSSSEVELLKESNKKLAIENVTLKKENEELRNQINTFVQEGNVEKVIEEKSDDEEKSIEEAKEKTQEEILIKENLNKKTIAQLKEVLNTEDFLPFKEEWQFLTKKDDIINFILKKIEEN